MPTKESARHDHRAQSESDHQGSGINLELTPTLGCPECGATAAEAIDGDCPECWKAHARRGLAWCESHGLVTAHVHAFCFIVVGRGRDRHSAECDEQVARWWPPTSARPIHTSQTGRRHAHCPLCWAFGTLWRTRHAPPSCAECRALLTERDLARLVAEVAELRRVAA